MGIYERWACVVEIPIKHVTSVSLGSMVTFTITPLNMPRKVGSLERLHSPLGDLFESDVMPRSLGSLEPLKSEVDHLPRFTCGWHAERCGPRLCPHRGSARTHTLTIIFKKTRLKCILQPVISWIGLRAR